jgi:hypothetical protein
MNNKVQMSAFASNMLVKRAIVPVVTIALLLCYHWIFSVFYPAANGNLGHDYSYVLSRLLDGYYWYLNNGLFSTHWFTPAFCGGVPSFPSPLSPFYSVPQWLTFVVNPLKAAYLTHLIFAALGFVGFYLLLRHCFKTSTAVALFGAALFLFNGFHAYRMAVGHLNFHAFMLTPLIGYFLLREGGNRYWLSLILNSSMAAVLISYMIYSGMFHLIMQVILVLTFIGLVHHLIFGKQLGFWLKLSLAGTIGGLLSLPKLVATMTFLGYFQRTDYLLPGADSLWGLIKLTFESLFLTASEETGREVMVNVQWALGKHELEYGVTLIPLIILLIGAVFVCRDRFKGGVTKLNPYQWLALLGITTIVIIPLALNFYTPGWNALLKETPILRNSSTLIRWMCMYIPIIILLSALVLERAAIFTRFRNHLSAIAIIGVVLIAAFTDKSLYHNQPYSPQHILDGYQEAKQSGKPPIITTIHAFVDEQGRPQLPPFRNDTLVKGASQLLCYEPIFGYGLENLPFGPLHMGRVDQAKDGVFNIKNPACYVYPEENNCKVGDHFTTQQPKEAEAFVSYKPYSFEISTGQKTADVIAAITLAALGLFWLGYGLSVIRRRSSPSA